MSAESPRPTAVLPVPPPCEAPLLFRVRDLRFGYGDREVLAVEELDLSEGEITVMAGENGSGKTTLLKLLNGLLAPSSGRIEYRGRALPGDGNAAVRRDTVLVHQNPYLLSGTVWQNVAYGLKVRRTDRSEIRRRVPAALERVGLSGFEGRRAAELSGGEGQRVALARALVLEPRVLLLDEPTANVDAETVRGMESLLPELSRSGTTLVLSSHHDAFAYRVGHRLLRLEGGRIRPNPENILKGVVVRLDERFTWFRVGRAELRCPAQAGRFTTAVLRHEEILLSRRPLESSARNRFRGRVRAVETGEHLVRVDLDCGFPLRTTISGLSAEEMDVRVGNEYDVTFKASSVRLY